MARKTPLNGTCAICNATITKKEAKKHISAGLRESGRDAKAMGRKKSPAKLFHLLVEGYGLSGDLYWMYLKASPSARVRDLDTFLRDTWLECCGHMSAALDRGAGLETHAYAFIHTNNLKTRIAELFGDDMQFDVIIGNPPYQLSDGGYGTSAAPIYQLFVEKALDLEPRDAVFVTPSRWMAGGKGLDKYRERMLSDKRLRSIVEYPKLYEGFPGVKIRVGYLVLPLGS